MNDVGTARSDSKINYTLEDIPPELAKQVLEFQDACNLSGVVHAFFDIMTKLWTYAHEHGKGTSWVNQHPLVFLTVDKLVQLSRYHVQDKGSNGIKIYDLIADAAKLKGK